MQSEFLGAKRPGVLLDAKMASVLLGLNTLDRQSPDIK
jgi:hypothetical protein